MSHLVMQCPAVKVGRDCMFREIRHIPDGTGAVFLDNYNDTFSILLGRCIDNLTLEQMESIWLTARKHINLIFRRSINLRKGIG